MSQLEAHAWITDGGPPFPEQATALMDRTANTGICLSGGGTRAMAAGIGQLRGLAALGLLDRIRYVSAVSGGTWVSAPLLFSRADEATLLGPVRDPRTLDLAALGVLPTDSLGHLATRSLRNTLYHLLHTVPDSQLWTESVATEYLAPLGLFDPKAPAYFSYDDATVADIKRRNPALAGEAFHTLRPGRPYWIGNGSIIGPRALRPLKREAPLGLEFTPLYIGSPRRIDAIFTGANGQRETATLGGGYVEPFAFGGLAPTTLTTGLNALPTPARRWTLADCVGVSSAAFAGYAELEHLIDVSKLAPYADLWSLPPSPPPTQSYALGDGGIIENYGIMALLRRGVERIVVFVNTGTRLDPKFNPKASSQWTGIDDYLPALFGYGEQGTGLALQNDHVFEQAAFQQLVDALVAARKAGEGLIAETRLQVLDNAWWGIAGGRTVDVTWVYNDRVTLWEDLVQADVREAIKQGNHAWLFHGPLEAFPNYATMGENRLELVELTNVQVNALADLTCWTVMHNAAAMQRALG